MTRPIADRMTRRPLLLSLGACLLAWAPGARGAGYALFEHGSAALGTAGAFTATADDPSAIFYNPAGIARLQGTELLVGISPIVPRLEFAGTAPYPGYDVEASWNDNVLLPPHAYATFPLRRGVTGGIGVYVPFGLRSDWRDPDAFPGRFIATFTEVNGVYLTPTVAVELTPSLSFGAGVSVVFADAALERRIPASVFDDGGQETVDVAELVLDGSPTTGITFDAGVLYDMGRLHFGLTYRHGVTNEIDGEARFRFLPTGDASRDSVLEARIPDDQAGTAEVPFPASASFGVSYDLGEDTHVEVNLNWMDWSAFDELPLTFEDPALSTRVAEDYEDVLNVRAGVSARVSEKLTFRGGYYFDDVPSPTASVGPVLPDARRHGLTAGFGYAYERWRLDVFQMMLLFEKRSVRDNRDGFNGDYAQAAWLSGVSLGYAIW